jgi:ribosomal protein S18 acetylase RimI-like enzyme
VNIRQARAEDLKLLDRYVKPAVGKTFKQDLDEQARDEHALFIASAKEEIFGWGFIRWHGPRDPKAKQLFPEAPEIYRLEVRESHRSQGIGRSLIAGMEAHAVARGFKAISLGVGHENPKAYSLYQELGFEDTELEEYFDEYQYPLKDGGFGTARDLCRYLVKRI